MAARVKCEACGKLLPADSDLALRVMMTTGDGRPLVGDLSDTPVGGESVTTASPAYYCTGCAGPAVSAEATKLVGEHQSRSS